MRRLNVLLMLGLIFTALAVVMGLGMNLVSGLVAGAYRNTPGLPAVLTAARIAGALAVLGLLAAMGVIAVATALTPGGWVRKAVHVVPALMLVLAVVGALLVIGGIGMTGTIALGSVPLPLSGLGTLVAGVGAILSVSIAAAAVHFDAQYLKIAVRAVGAAALMAALATAVIGVAAWRISTSQPSFGGEASFGRPPGGQAPSGAPASGTQSTPGPRTEPFGQGRSGFPEGGLRRGGALGALGNTSRIFPIAVAFGVVLSLAALGFGVAGWRRAHDVGGETVTPDERVSGKVRGELARAAAALCGVAALGLVLIQFIPASRTNPPVQSTVAWDSAETKRSNI